MSPTLPLLRNLRRLLADQERALRAASLAESSRTHAPELRAMYTRHVDPPETVPPTRLEDPPVTVSPVVQLKAS
jgi:hypothetical protein